MLGWIPLRRSLIHWRRRFPDYLISIHAIEKTEFLSNLLGCNRAFSG